jgi:hygromycin-B 7''-O-kinase
MSPHMSPHLSPDIARLTPQTAQAIVDRFQPEYRVTETVARTGGEVSAVYEVRGAGAARPLVVKVFAPQWRPKMIKEVYVYRLLARHGIRHIPAVLHAAPAGVPGLPFAYTVMTRLDGEPLSQIGERLTTTDVARVYRQMGQILASVHQITRAEWGYVTTRVVDARPTNTAYMTDQFARKLGVFVDLGGDPELARAIDGYVARHAAEFAACTQPVLCHGDFHDGNVLVTDDARVSGFVDVEGAVAADPLLDLARTDYYALRDALRRDAFMSGYGQLPADADQRIATYRLHHALELCNWARSTGKPADTSRAMTDLIAITTGRPLQAGASPR